MIFNFKVTGQVIDVTCPTVVDQTNDYLDAEFTFSPEWDGLVKEAYFQRGDETPLKFPLMRDKITKDMHLNLGEGGWKVFVFGLDAGSMVISTDCARISVARTGKRDGTIPPETPPSEIDLILKKSEEALQKADSVCLDAENGKFNGRDGRDGRDGIEGPEGPIGPKGKDGINGKDGVAGPQGPKGETGPVGPKGDRGPQGEVGPKGDTGLTGPKGDTGLQGPVGPQGERGLTGPEGPAGPSGKDGATGPRGEVGPAGSTGPKGDSGVYVGSDVPPKGTNVQVDPNGNAELVIPEVFDTTGPSTEDTMSQKAISDELAKKLTKSTNGTAGQFAVSDGKGGITWKTLDNAESMRF